jgi:hypothetical protein
MSIGFHLYWWVLMSREFDGLRKCNGASTFRLRRAAAREWARAGPRSAPWRRVARHVDESGHYSFAVVL